MFMEDFIQQLPKAELHLHIEGTFEPELMMQIAQRNKLQLPYSSVEEIKKAYQFNNLQEFLDIYYAGANVLIQEQDFYDLTNAYLKKCKEQNVVHVEIFFDPQTHTERGISFDTVINGIYNALKNGEEQFGISSKLIMSYLRHLSEESAFETLEKALPYKHWIDGVGLDSSEVGNPPSKFKRVFEKSKQEGFLLMAHAGEEGPSDYVWEALNELNIDRIDHGNRSMEDEVLVEELAKRKMGLTVCPLSNLKLCVVENMQQHPIKNMLDKNLKVTINSDDPAYFGGYMNENYLSVVSALNLSKQDIIQLTKNAFEVSFLDEATKSKWIKQLDSLSS
ncbi:MAG: adenosine deaminase [Bacteroidia bacterium]